MLALALSLIVSFAAAATDDVTLSGTIVDAEGRPAACAQVFLADGRLINPRGEFLSEGQVPVRPIAVAQSLADDVGAFNITRPNEVPQSDWARTWLVLWVHRPGSTVGTYLIGRDWPALTTPVEVRLPIAQSLSLVVVGPDEKPVRNARVLPEQVNDVRLPRELAEQLGATTNDGGVVVLREVGPTSLDLVRIASADYGVQCAALPPAERDGSRRIVLSPVATVRGRLTADDPRAIAAVKVRLATWRAAGDDGAGGGLAEAITDAEGRFEVPAIAAGALSAAVDLRADLPFRCQRITGRPIADGTTNDLTINLRRAVRVEGVVRDRDSHQPVAGAAVWLDRFALQSEDPRSDEGGRYSDFVLAGQTAPSFRRIPRQYYFPQATLDSQPVPEEAERVELKPLLFARGVTVCGRVVDRNEQGVAGAEITAHWELATGGEYSLHAHSDRAGGFTLDGVEPNAQLKLWASSDRGATAEAVVISAIAGNTVKLVVDPSNSLALAGRVLDGEKRPVAGAIVRTAWQRPSADGRPDDVGHLYFGGRQRLVTDAEGRFDVPAVPARGWEYRAEAGAAGMLPAVTEFMDPIAWNTATFGDIELHPIVPLRAIEGRVVDQHGRGIGGLRVFQSGDGPRRTESTSARDGRFTLRGVYAEPVFVLVSGDGYPLQGFLIDHGKPAELRVVRANEPANRQLRSLDEPLTPAKRREVALRLIEPLLPGLKEGELEREKVLILGTLATLDPNRVAEFSKLPIFNALGLGDEALYQEAQTLVGEDLEEALAAAETIGQPHFRGRVYLAACDRLSGDQPHRKVDLLTTALLHARAEPDVAQRTELLGQIAERWLDLGEIERGTALLREGEKLAEQLPAPSEAAERAHDQSAHLRAFFAGSLARIDGPAALKLSAGFTSSFADRYRIVVARGLAGHDPAAAEQLLDDLDSSARRYYQGLPLLHRMASVDPERAARLARKCDSDAERGYALGIVAHGLAGSDAVRAQALLDEAYLLIAQAAAQGFDGVQGWEHPSVLAAALLPVAERIDPALIDGYFWRAMALRPPRAARMGGDGALGAAALATFISRYDRESARALAAPLAAQIKAISADGESWRSKLAWASLAVVDAAKAESLIDALPDPPPTALRAAKNVARRHVADALAPSADTWWHKFYEHLSGLHDPDARDDAR